jgi:hypothetical protein
MRCRASNEWCVSLPAPTILLFATGASRRYSSPMAQSAGAPIGLSAESRLVLSKDQMSCDLAGEAAVVNLKNGVYYGLDAVGARVWNLMREPVTLETILDSLLGLYAVERTTLEYDVRRFLNQLADQGLVEITT